MLTQNACFAFGAQTVTENDGIWTMQQAGTLMDETISGLMASCQPRAG